MGISMSQEWEMRNTCTYKTVIGNPEDKRPLNVLVIDGKIILT
jgi:hypothetical protein